MILEYNKPFETRTSTLRIDGLKAGVYQFQLRVINDAGKVSKPDIARVQVQSGIRDPLPGVTPVDREKRSAFTE
ncbi:hypothetical protein [Desulfobacula sp.]|uniref:hypothetical protein n=1 Tax=Desulfobacula sp. TaxID=2593537 RepID=UPI0026091AAD|nr:hypothetical protein [Desulfobacula sp.]